MLASGLFTSQACRPAIFQNCGISRSLDPVKYFFLIISIFSIFFSSLLPTHLLLITSQAPVTLHHSPSLIITIYLHSSTHPTFKMQYSSAILLAAFAATNVFAHGVIDSVQGANGVTMPALSVADGTPRDCASPGCGSEVDTSIIREKELGTSKASALGRTANGPVDASKMIALFMGDGANSTDTVAAREIHSANVLRRSLGERAANGGTKTPKGTKETAVKAATGAGASSGLPTTADDGSVTMTFHQVNQDGAGPLTAMVDPTSGGTDPKAFKQADVTTNVPGIGIGGLSAAQTMDFPVVMAMPAGMTCSGSVGGASNVCVARLQNSAITGPFGGSCAFTQSAAAKKRAIEYNLSKRRFARSIAKQQQ
ncbi:cell surface protein [Diplocarpon rosae]|nr:cell surface protein [Diplocarpon rosae]